MTVTETQPEIPKKNGRRKMLALVVFLIATAAAAWYYLNSRLYESTDDAFVDADIIQVSPRVPGQVLRVVVTDNQRVKRGELIAEIDPRDYEARLEEAKARLADTLARAGTAQSNLALTSAVSGAVLVQADAGVGAARIQLEVLKARTAQEKAAVEAAQASRKMAEARSIAAEAEAARAASDLARYKALFAKDEISKQLLDRSEADARATAANFEASKQAVQAAAAQLAQTRAAQASTAATLDQAERQLKQAEGRLSEAKSAPIQVRVRESDVKAVKAQIEQQQAAVRLAELSLSYTRIVAPAAGYVTRKSVQPGNFLGVGQVMMAIVTDRMWVAANFKETQLTHMRPGQAATIKLDAFPQLDLEGRVESIQSGSGARFSLMPPENATGNYVKVVQRVPVRIAFTNPLPSGYRIGPGMSVVPEVRVR